MDASFSLPPLHPSIPRTPITPRTRLLHNMPMLIPSRRPRRTSLLALNHRLMRHRNLIIPLPPSTPPPVHQNLLITPHRRRMMHRRPKPTQPPTLPPASSFRPRPRPRFRPPSCGVMRGKRVIALAPPSTRRPAAVAAWPAVAE